MIVLLMGVAGAGKTTVGQELSRILSWRMVDADSLHPQQNIAKMHAGIPLTDADRKSWLDEVARRIRNCIDKREHCVIACSALKERYRRVLLVSPEVRVVYLAIKPEVAHERVAQRSEHFMPSSLVASQFADLEAPAGAITVDANAEPQKVAKEILSALGISAVPS